MHFTAINFWHSCRVCWCASLGFLFDFFFVVVVAVIAMNTYRENYKYDDVPVENKYEAGGVQVKRMLRPSCRFIHFFFFCIHTKHTIYPGARRVSVAEADAHTTIVLYTREPRRSHDNNNNVCTRVAQPTFSPRILFLCFPFFCAGKFIFMSLKSKKGKRLELVFSAFFLFVLTCSAKEMIIIKLSVNRVDVSVVHAHV